MRQNSIIYPMAFVPKRDLTCRLFYVCFPKAWKTKLIEIEKIKNPKRSENCFLPTKTLENSLNAWMDGFIKLMPLNEQSKDEMWVVSCDEEIDLYKLFEHIRIWLQAYTDSGKKENKKDDKKRTEIKNKIKDLIEMMRLEELEELSGTREIRLFNDEGEVSDSFVYQAFPLMVNKVLVGKTIMIGGHEIIFNYAGKNKLVSEIQGKENQRFSYGISFSLKTVPPENRTLLLCQCVIHRWICKKWSDKPYIKDRINACVWVGNNRIYRVPLLYDKTSETGYVWEKTEKAMYNLYQFQSLPDPKEVIDHLEHYLSGDQLQIALPYKNGLKAAGFKENDTGVGVSIKDKKVIYDHVLSYLSEFVEPTEDVVRVKRTKYATMNPPLEEIKINEKFTDSDSEILNAGLKNSLEQDHLKIEIYYNDDAKECALEMTNRLKTVFRSTNEMHYDFECCPLRGLGEPLDSSNEAGVQKRINEIKHNIKASDTVIASIVFLPDKEYYEKHFKGKDPKGALRCGLALQHRLSQFIVPWRESEQKQSKAKMNGAIADLCRQLGYIHEMNDKAVKNDSLLFHTPAVGIHLISKRRLYMKSKEQILLFVEVDYASGKVYVECDAFDHKRVPYHEAAFELARLCVGQNNPQTTKETLSGALKEKMMIWKNIYREKNLLVLIEGNWDNYKIFKGITDKALHEYVYLKPYCPQKLLINDEVENGKIDFNETGIRIVRIKRNDDVPDYYTDLTDENQHRMTSGLFKYGYDYWSVLNRPNDKTYWKSFINTQYDSPTQKFAERDMIEIYPIQLQREDDPDEWVIFANSLRNGFIQYSQVAVLPIPLHLANALEEYVV